MLGRRFWTGLTPKRYDTSFREPPKTNSTANYIFYCLPVWSKGGARDHQLKGFSRTIPPNFQWFLSHWFFLVFALNLYSNQQGEATVGEVFSLRSRVGQPHQAVSGEGEGYNSRLLNTHDKACMSKWLAWQSRLLLQREERPLPPGM